MNLVTLDVRQFDASAADFPVRAREYCAQLEAGDILFFPQSPIAIAAEDLEFLLSAQQTGAGYHKNIAYRPAMDKVTGFVKDRPEVEERLRTIMRKYSQGVVKFLSGFLAPYQTRWTLDYASYRPQEEQGRDLTLRKRNDLLHTDAFPTRPTHGDRILRFFNNINPSQTRNWVTAPTFDVLVEQFVGSKQDAAPPELLSVLHKPSAASALLRGAGRTLGLGKLVPALKRSRYDEFMMRFHNFLKENEDFQKNCEKWHWQFPPGSSWMVYTDMVAHAVLSGQYALEQTFLVSKDAMVTPEKSPVTVVERLAKGAA